MQRDPASEAADICKMLHGTESPREALLLGPFEMLSLPI